MTISRPAILLGLSLLALASVAGFVVSAERSDGAAEFNDKQHIATGALSVLKQSVVNADALPASVLATPAMRRFADPSGARLAVTIGNRQYFVVPGAENSVCLIFVEGPRTDPTSGGTCAGRDTLRNGAVYLSEPGLDGTATIAGIVSDGITQAAAGSTSVAVVNNVFVLSNAFPSTVALDGPSVSINADLGAPAPTSTVETP